MLTEYGIYRLPNGWEVAAIADPHGRLMLYRIGEFSEDAQPHMYYDPLLNVVRYVGDDPDDFTADPTHWTVIAFGRNVEDTGRQIVTCDCCGVPVWEPESTPDILDDQEWAQLGLQHEENCEWITSKAFKI